MGILIPPGMNRDALLGPISVDDQTWRDPNWRRFITRDRPIYFAIIYLWHLLDPESTGTMSLARMHIDMHLEAKRWPPGGPRRHWWVAPRNSGKTTWLFQILPLWALAHGHVRYALAIGDSGARAAEHLDGARQALKREPALLHDFPMLAPGRKDSAETLITAGGSVFAARGWTASTLGTNVEGNRPGLIVVDDLEPAEEGHTQAARDKRLTALTSTIMPMNANAIVQVDQSVPRHGSLSHDIVRAVHRIGEPAEWIDAGNWGAHHYPAIELGPDGEERSFWPERDLFRLERLQRERRLHPHAYALNQDGRALPPGQATSWRDELFRVLPDYRVSRRVLAIDGAVTVSPSADYTGFCLMAAALGPRPVEHVVEIASGFRTTPAQTRSQAVYYLTHNPDVRDVIIEGNNGGLYLSHALADLNSDLPPGHPAVRVELVPAGRMSKADKLADLLYRFESDKIRQAGSLPEFQAQAKSYPDPTAHDDILDSVWLADRWLTEHAR